MRINKFVAQATGMSRRAADRAVAEGRVTIGGSGVKAGAQTSDEEDVRLDGKPLRLPDSTTIILNKPASYVCSRDGQGSVTIYELLPKEYCSLKPVGRLDKDSSGLLLLTNDGELANKLTHPRYGKTKVYEIEIDKSLTPEDQTKIEQGVGLEDGPSKLKLNKLDKTGKRWRIMMTEGRNRQIRRTFAALNYNVTKLNRTQLGSYSLPPQLNAGEWARAARPPAV